MTVKTYSDTFWHPELNSTAGYDVLVKRNQESKRMFQDLEEYLKKRSKVEAEYSKALSSLTKCFKQRDAIGVMEATLNQWRLELDTISSSHQGASVFFQQQAEQLKKVKEEQTAARKLAEESVYKAQSAKLSQLSKTLQAEKNYVRKSVQRDDAENSQKEIHLTNAQPKEIEKAKNKAIKCQEEAEKADSNYKSAVMVLEDCRVNWVKAMEFSCQSIQSLDEERLKFLRAEIWTAVNVDSKLALDSDNCCETVRDILEKCDVTSDIQAFIESSGIGQRHPDAFEYRHYTIIRASTDNDNESTGSDHSNPYSSIDDDENGNNNGNTSTRTNSTGSSTSTQGSVLPRNVLKLPRMFKKSSS